MDFGFPAAPVLRADVDGDGRLDRVTTEVGWLDSTSCVARLVVQTRRGTLTSALGDRDMPLLAPPPLAALVPLPHTRGLTIVVEPWRGASTEFSDVYAIHTGRLRKLDARPFPFSGSLTHLDGVDCSRKRGSVLVASHASVDGDGYRVVRRFFVLHRMRLLARPALTETYRVAFEDVWDFPEIATVAFPQCATVRAP